MVRFGQDMKQERRLSAAIPWVMQHHRRLGPTRTAILAILTFLSVCMYFGQGVILPFSRSRSSGTSTLDVTNSSLGFQKIFLLNMPARTDKLDAFSMSASFTPFQFEVFPGVDGETILRKTLPGPWPGDIDNHVSTSGSIGCWRGHLNFARKIVNERISTALIFEDDADWDYHLRAQLVTFAMGSRALLGQTSTKNVHSPYGDGWDILWIGHCASSPKPGDKRRFIISNDKTVPPVKRRSHVWNFGQEGLRYDNSTRLVYQADTGTCTFAYALSYIGAQKVLQHVGISGVPYAIDSGLDNMCRNREGIYNFTCINAFPNLVDARRWHGGMEKADSDINGIDAPVPKDKGTSYTHNIRYSMRSNIIRLLDGKEPISQWHDDADVTKGPVKTEWVSGQG